MQIHRLSEYLWEIPACEKKGMRVPARIYASERLIHGFDQGVLDQITQVACLPGIVKHALCMPDGHLGYGFPIGGVAAFSTKKGVISPGGIGFDINCGVRLIRTNLDREEVETHLTRLVEALFRAVPSGVGRGKGHSLSKKEMRQILLEGAECSVRKGFGWPQDLALIEGGGKIAWTDPDAVSEHAIERGMGQIGTLGSGNHYLEVQVVSEIFDERAAAVFGLRTGQVVVMVHCGSRGLGHQVATDYIKRFEQVAQKYHVHLPDRKLAAAPFASSEGQQYYRAMAAAANFAFANRQVITDQIRKVFSKLFSQSAETLEMEIIYDVAHNIAKREVHEVNGKRQEVLVHRKGATRAFGPGSDEIPEKYQKIGQPVIIGGSMETGSYLLLGTRHAEAESFGSTLHGAGRVLSRRAARRQARGKDLLSRMVSRGIIVRAASLSGLAEEAAEAYKDVSEVIHAVDGAGLSKKVAKMKPLGNIKG